MCNCKNVRLQTYTNQVVILNPFTKIKQMTQPVRIKRSRQFKQVSPNGLPITYVGRGSKWGNPFRVVKIGKNEWSVKLSDNNVSSAKILTKICRFIYT